MRTSDEGKSFCGWLLAVVSIVWMTGPTSAFAAKHLTKKDEPSFGPHRFAAAAPSEANHQTTRVSMRKVRGVSAIRQRSSRRILRHSIDSDGRSRREQILDASRIKVIDGETFSYGGESIRIQGITAPAPFDLSGKEARQQLEALLQQGRVTMIPKGSDRSGGKVAEIRVDHRNVADLINVPR
jgi:endonuclease YncB( thermonuclease family)